MKTNKFLKGALFCTLAGITFGGQWPVAGSALKVIDPFYFTMIRYLIVAVTLTLILIIVEGKEKLKFEGQILPLWFFGTMAFCIYNFLVFVGQKMIGKSGAIFGSMLMALIPVVSVIVLWVYKKIKPPKFTLGCILFALLGVWMVITKGDLKFFMINKNQILPIVLMSVSVFAWVIYTIGGSNFQSWSPLRYTTLSCILGNVSSMVIITIATALGFLQVPTIESIGKIGLQMSYMSLIAGVIGVLAWNAGNKILTPMNGSLFINLVPLVTFLIAIINGYQVSNMEIAGALITISALVCNNLYQRRMQAQKQNSRTALKQAS